jgi:aminoglycoside phosphotransferase (APT) family kinase protein
MIPSIERMLAGARKTLVELSENLSPSDKSKISALDAVMVELLLRNDSQFYRSHFESGLALAHRGSRLMSATGKVEFESDFRNLAAMPEFDIDRILPLREMLQNLVQMLATPQMESSPHVKTFLADVVDWETAFHARHASYPPAHSNTTEYLNPDKLLAYLENKFNGRTPRKVENLQTLTGGFSKKTVLFDLIFESGPSASLVIRAEQPPRFGFWDGDQVRNEFPVLQLVHEAGLPVPKPLWLEQDTSLLGQPFLVSEKARGANIGTSAGNKITINPDAVADIVRNLAAIHNTRLDPQDTRIRSSHLAPWSNYQTLTECTTAWVKHWIEKVRSKGLRPSPMTARVLSWLLNNVPRCEEEPRLLHGDFGVHNILMDGDRVSAVLDWEYLTFGDPAEDMALLYMTLGGAVEKKTLLSLYNQFGGMAIDDYRLRYFDVMYSMKFIVPPENALHLYEEDEVADFKLCQFGFQYTHIGASTINAKIALAEDARNL